MVRLAERIDLRDFVKTGFFYISLFVFGAAFSCDAGICLYSRT